MNLPTFGIWKRKNPEVIEYKQKWIDGMESSTDEFYNALESDLMQREVPGLEITREEFSEGGLLSSKRVYLRMRRERMVFDVCSAPFGKTWFFSYRFAFIPVSVMVWEILLVLAVLAAIVFGYVQLFGPLWGGVIIGVTLLGIGILLRNSLALGLYGLDDMLLRLPVFGIVYEVMLRKETYYREDSRTMFMNLVRGLIEARTDEFVSAQGFQQTPFVEARPDLHSRLVDLLKQPRPVP